MDAYFNAVQALSPVAYWRLGETNGAIAYDASANTLNGTYTGTYALGADTLVPSEADKSLSLSNAGYVGIGASNALSLPAFTIVGFVKLSSLGGLHRLFTHYRTPEAGPYNGVALMVTTTNQLELFTCSNYFSDSVNRSRSTATIAQNTVYQIAASFSGGTVKIYINGVLDSAHTGKQTPDYTNAQVNIGGMANVASFNGVIDEVCLFDRALSDSEIADLYAASVQTYPILGIITDRLGNPCQRKVYAMSRPTDAAAPILLAHGLSDPTTGAYELIVPTGDEVTRVVVSEDDDGPLLNDLVDRVIPA